MFDRRRAFVLPFLLAVAVANGASAQAPEPPPPLKLVLEADAKLGPGTYAAAKGVTAARLARFAVEGLDVAQPITVVVATSDPAKPVEVRIAKDNFNDPEQKAMTGSDGTVTFQFRTHGDFGIGVAAPDSSQRAFQLAVWVGDIVPPEIPSFLAPVSGYDAATLAKLKVAGNTSAEPAAPSPPSSGAGAFGWLGLAVGAVAAIGIVLIGIAMLRRKPQGGQ